MATRKKSATAATKSTTARTKSTSAGTNSTSAGTKSLPMYFPSSPFSLSDAQMCSTLVNTAYDMYQQWKNQNSPSNPSSFRWTPNGPSLQYSAPMWGVATTDLGVSYPEPFAFLANNSATRKTYLAFRGSETYADFEEDADIFQSSYNSIVSGFGWVHAGFLDVYTRTYSGSGYSVPSLRSTILKAFRSLTSTTATVYITGHSLGAGLSTLAVPDVVRNAGLAGGNIPTFHYSLASPRVGDPGFAYNYNFNLPATTYRIVNTEDIVPYGPPPISGFDYYEHVGTPVDFTAQYGSTGGNHDHLNSYYYALTHTTQPQGPVVLSAEYPGLKVAAALRQREIQKGMGTAKATPKAKATAKAKVTAKTKGTRKAKR
jgi:triacylglycerol lipase